MKMIAYICDAQKTAKPPLKIDGFYVKSIKIDTIKHNNNIFLKIGFAEKF